MVQPCTPSLLKWLIIIEETSLEIFSSFALGSQPKLKEKYVHKFCVFLLLTTVSEQEFGSYQLIRPDISCHYAKVL